MNNYLKYSILLLLTNQSWLFAQSSIKGEATLILDQTWDSDGNPQNQTGLRYIPTWSVVQPQSYKYRLDTEIAGNFSFYKYPDESRFSLKNNWACFHRYWIRLTTDRFEARLGLQKITFGSARLFRPLAWFDQLDPRDPQQYTTGVTGLRLRYDFPDNTGVWLWGIFDENLDFDQISENYMLSEFGGRLSYPIGPGEMGLAYNQRVDYLKLRSWGADGVWDVGIGIWIETALTNYANFIYYDWLSQLTIGTDYTFGVGNGLTVTAEINISDSGDDIFSGENQTNLWGLMASYPVSILDNLSLISFYYPDGDFQYNYVSWQRTYDNWLVQVSAFFTTGEELSFIGSAMSTVGNKGFQLNLIYNH